MNRPQGDLCNKAYYREDRPLVDVVQNIMEIEKLHAEKKIVNIEHLQPTFARAKERIKERKGTWGYQITAFFLSIVNISTFEDEALAKVSTFEQVLQIHKLLSHPLTIPEPTPKTMSREALEFGFFENENLPDGTKLFSNINHYITPYPVRNLQDSEIKNDFLIGPNEVQISINTVQLEYNDELGIPTTKGTFIVLPTRYLLLLESEDELLLQRK